MSKEIKERLGKVDIAHSQKLLLVKKIIHL